MIGQQYMGGMFGFANAKLVRFNWRWLSSFALIILIVIAYQSGASYFFHLKHLVGNHAPAQVKDSTRAPPLPSPTIIGGPGRRVRPRTWFVTPDGSPANDGEKETPLDLATALKSEGVSAGDTIMLGGGVYKGEFTSTLAGTVAEPIIVRAAKGARVTVDGSLTVRGFHTWLWGLEVTNSDPDRTKERPTGVNCFGLGTRLINLVIHDCGNGVGFWSPVQDGEVYGCIIYHNGWQGEGNDRGHGHAIYTQNEVGTKRLINNIMFDQYGWGIHAYTQQGMLKGFRIEGNIIFNNGLPTRQNVRYENILVGGYKPVERLEVIENCTYHTPDAEGNNVRLYYTATDNKDLVCESNYFMGGSTVLGVHGWEKVVMSGNTLWGKNVLADLDVPLKTEMGAYDWNHNTYIAGDGTTQINFRGAKSFSEWKKVTGFDSESEFIATVSRRPTGVKVFTRPNQYEPGRAHLAIYNWAKMAAVRIDLRGVLKKGERFRILAAQNYFGPPVLEAVFEGQPISLPMTTISVPMTNRSAQRSGSRAHLPRTKWTRRARHPRETTPIGQEAATPIGQEFGAFVVERLSNP